MWTLLGSTGQVKAPPDELSPQGVAQAYKLAREWQPANGVPKRVRSFLGTGSGGSTHSQF